VTVDLHFCHNEIANFDFCITHVRLAGGWLLVLVCSNRKVLLVGW
jgi:hypothetical protein